MRDPVWVFKLGLTMHQKLKSSFYNIPLDIDNLKVIYNSLSGAIVQINNDKFAALADGNLDGLDQSDLKILTQNGIVVPSDANELLTYSESYEDAKRSGTMSVQLKLASNCNLSCSYCYQSATDRPKSLINDRTIVRLTQWLESEFKHNPPDLFHFELYGGEPLLAKQRIPRLLSEVHRICGSYKVPVNFSAITNGTLFDENTIKVFIEYEVDTKISIDGIKSTHDRRRISSSKIGSYDRVISTIRTFVSLGGVDLITVRMNFDHSNIEEVSDVASLVNSLGIKKFECGNIHFRRPSDYGSEIDELSIDAEYELKLFNILHPFGYATSAGDLSRVMPCALHKERYYALTPDLKVYKCDELDQNRDLSVGQIDEAGEMQTQHEQLLTQIARNPTDFASCAACRYLPICGGGCSVRALEFKGSLNTNYCQMSFQKVLGRVRAHLASISKDQ